MLERRHIPLIRFMTFISCYIMYYTYITYTHYGQVHQDHDLGLEDHAATAKTVDDLGDQFRTAMRAGWLSYIRHGQRHPCCLPARGAGHVGDSRLSRLCFRLLQH
jgi:hypothetical protein